MMTKEEILIQKIDRLSDQLTAVESVSSVDELDTDGVPLLTSIVSLRCECAYLLESHTLRKAGLEDDLERYHSLRDEVSELLTQQQYREQLFVELSDSLEQLPRMVCYFFEVDPIGLELKHDLLGRDVIESVLLTLDEYDDISEERLRVDAIDEVFRCRYESVVDRILEEYPEVERPYSPDSYWWRHPSRVADSDR